MTTPPEASEQSPRTEPPVSRRRGEALQRAIFDTVIDQLGTVGYAKLSTNRVAAAAGTGKAALYRRWRNKEELVRDALRDLLPEPPEIIPGTPLRDGLVALLAYLNQALYDSKGAAFQAVAAAGADQTSELRVLFHESATAPCEQRIIELVRRHGGAPGTNEAALAATGPAMLVYHCISGQPKSTDEQIEAVVDDLLLPLIRAGRAERPDAGVPGPS